MCFDNQIFEVEFYELKYGLDVLDFVEFVEELQNKC